MFVILGAGALAVLGVVALFLPPDFEQWKTYKHMLLTDNPVKMAVGFIMCTLTAFEFAVWYLVMYQLLRLIVWGGPFVIVYLVVRYFTS